MGDLERFGTAMDFIAGMVEIRKMYNSFEDIAENETYSTEERREAKELIEGGVYKFMYRIKQADGKG